MIPINNFQIEQVLPPKNKLKVPMANWTGPDLEKKLGLYNLHNFPRVTEEELDHFNTQQIHLCTVTVCTHLLINILLGHMETTHVLTDLRFHLKIYIMPGEACLCTGLVSPLKPKILMKKNVNMIVQNRQTCGFN